MTPEYAKDMLLRLSAAFPGFVTDENVPGTDLVEWLSNEFFYLLETGQGEELRERALHGSPPDDLDPITDERLGGMR